MEDGNLEQIEFLVCSTAIKKEISDESDNSCESSNLLNENTTDEEQCDVEPNEGESSEDTPDEDFTVACEPIVEINEEAADGEEDEGGCLNNQERRSEDTVTEGNSSTPREKDDSVECADLAKPHGNQLDSIVQNRIFENAASKNDGLQMPAKGPFPCSVCGKTFVKFGKSLRNHYLQHSSDKDLDVIFKNYKPHKCTVCSYSCKDSSTLKRHISSVHKNERPYSCDVCDKRYNRRTYLKLHKLNNHASERPFKCLDCPYTCATNSRLIDHVRVHTGEKKIRVCKRCKESFTSKYELEKHRASKHRGKTPFQCDRCPYSSWHSGDFVSHQAVHSEEKKFACDVCGKTFALSNRLRNHKLVHIDDENKKFRCTVCPYAAASSFYLKLHMRRHTGEKNFACEICKKEFANRVRLKRHTSMVHQTTVYNVKKPFACELCDKSYMDNPGLVRHTRIVHKERPVQTSVT